MTNKEIEKEVKALNKYGEELLTNPKRADEFFVKVGIYTPDGKLTKEYGGQDF